MRWTFRSGALTLLIGILISCSPSYTSWHYPAGDPEASNAVAGSVPNDFKHSKTVKIDLPAGVAKDAAVYLGDIRGSRRPEVIIVTPERILGYTLGGRRLFDTSPPNSRLVGGFLFDFDRDGKQDIVVGTLDAPRAGFMVYGGYGEPAYQYTFEREAGNYLAIEPEFVLGDGLYLLAQESWPQNPRSLIKFSLTKKTEEWEFFLPSRPVALVPFRIDSGETGLLVSQQTQSWGEFVLFGLEGEATFGFDSTLHLLVVRDDGAVDRLLPVMMAGNGVEGRGLFYPAMKLLRQVHVEGTAGVLGPVFGGSDDRSSFALLAVDTRLYTVSDVLELRLIAEVSSPQSIAAAVSESRAVFVAVGKSLEIVTVTW